MNILAFGASRATIGPMDNYWNNEEYNRVHGPNADGPDTSSSEIPERTPGEQLATMASFMGIAAIVTTFCMPVIAPGILASLSIILAILSRGHEQRMPKATRTALSFGIAGLVVYIGFLGVAGFTTYRMVTDSNARSYANEIMSQMYGYSLDDLLNAIDGEYGTELEMLPMEDL